MSFFFQGKTNYRIERHGKEACNETQEESCYSKKA